MNITIISHFLVVMNKMIPVPDLLEFLVMMESTATVKIFVLEQVQIEIIPLTIQERVDTLEILVPTPPFAMDLAMKQLKAVH